MKKEIALLNRIIPDELGNFVMRYTILSAIDSLQPVGRRGIAMHTGMSERIVRRETDILYAQGLIIVEKSGMTIAVDGTAVLDGLGSFIKILLGLNEHKKKLEKMFNIKDVTVVAGDCSVNDSVKFALGKAAASVLLENTEHDKVIALTGGTTVSRMVEAVDSSNIKRASYIVPARGSIGNKVELHSDTLVSVLAEKLAADYGILNISDSLGIKAMNEMKNEPEIQDIAAKMKETGILVFGIGNALDMAKKRGVSEMVYDFLLRKQAECEAFGSYFNKEGQIVYTSRSISMKLEDIARIPCKIAVVGGSQKATAIISLLKGIRGVTLVTDEGAAMEIIRIIENKN